MNVQMKPQQCRLWGNYYQHDAQCEACEIKDQCKELTEKNEAAMVAKLTEKAEAKPQRTPVLPEPESEGCRFFGDYCDGDEDCASCPDRVKCQAETKAQESE